MDANIYNQDIKKGGRNKSAIYEQEGSKFLKTINTDARPFSNETDKLPETNKGGNFSSEFSLSKPTNTGLNTAYKTAGLKQ